MSNDLILDLKNKHYICKKCKIEIKTDHPELEDKLDLIELLMNKENQIEINISQDNENNSNSNQKKFNNIDESFWKDKSLFDFLTGNIDVQKDIIQENSHLLKQIFDKRYKLFPNNVSSLSEYSSHYKNKIDLYCSEDNDMSIYFLFMLYHNFNNLFDYIEKVVNFDTMKPQDFSNFKEIIYLIGKDIKKIFKTAVKTIDKDSNFKLENVIMSLFNDFLIKKNISKGPNVIHAALINERKYFEDIIKRPNGLKFTNNIIKWANDPIPDINEEKKSKFNAIYIINEDKNYNNKEKTKTQKKEKNINIKTSSNEECNNKDVGKLDIEDLVSYINDPKSNANHKKKQKKKKKSKKSSKEVNNIIIADKNENNNIDEDEDIADFKKCIEDFTTHNNRFLYQNKIEPSISKAFIKRLENN